jgi:excinuclease ABC subunit A
VNAIVALKEGDKVYILATFKQHTNRNIKEELNILVQKGFSRMYDQASGEVLRIEELLEKSDKELKGLTKNLYPDRPNRSEGI